VGLFIYLLLGCRLAALFPRGLREGRGRQAFPVSKKDCLLTVFLATRVFREAQRYPHPSALPGVRFNKLGVLPRLRRRFQKSLETNLRNYHQSASLFYIHRSIALTCLKWKTLIQKRIVTTPATGETGLFPSLPPSLPPPPPHSCYFLTNESVVGG